MISDGLIELIALQAGREANAHSTYLSFAFWAANQGYPGAAGYFKKQAYEELEHRDKILAFLNDYADVASPIPGVEAPPAQVTALRETFSLALELELRVTDAIRELTQVACEEGSQEVVAFLNWFNLEQIASVSELRGYVRAFERAGDNEAAVRMIDASFLD